MPGMASAQRGIAPEGREFFIGYMPPAQERQITTYYVLVGSAVDQRVTVSYFDENGQESGGQSYDVAPLTVKKIELNRLRMRPEKPGEKLEYKAAVVRSKYPVSVQAYNEGTLSGGMLLAIPTPALGKHYVVSAWNDNPTIPEGLQSGWNGHNLKDSSCSEFMIIGAYNNTQVQITPNSTTFAGQIGVNSGYKSDGKPHPKQITINKGQVYWVRSNPGDISFDLSNSVIRSDKPIAVIAGHEKALLGDPSGIWRFMDNDFRDMMIEQMIPVESWATGGYVSIPFEPPLRKDTRMLKNGEGDLYRMYTYKQGGASVLYQGGRVSPYEYLLAEYQLPVAQRENVIEDAVNIFERDADKMNVVMYDYFQGIHDQDPGESAGEKGGKTTESTNYTCPNEMNIIPIRNWRKTALFKVPKSNEYRGGQFINLITTRDSLSKIFIKINGTNEKQMSSMPSRRQFNIPGYPDLVGIRYQLAPSDYYIYGNTPFACYSYGRTEGWYKDDYGYAAPVSGAFGNFEEDVPPKIEITPNCSSWDVKITDIGPGAQGLADAFMLNDPNAQLWQPARVTVNMRMTPEPLILSPTDSVANIQILVIDPFKDATGYLYIVDRAGNDTVYTFTYKAPSFTKSLDSIQFGALDVGMEKCSTVVFTNTAKPGGIPVVIEKIDLLFKNQDIRISSISKPLPVTLNGGESVSVEVCFKATDALVIHLDSLLLKTDCFLASIPLEGSGKAPSILAGDYDFGTVSLGGDPVCADIKVENIGTAPFTLTKDWVLHNTSEFQFADFDKLPLVIQPGKWVMLKFCYNPTKISDKDSTTQDWGTDMTAPFKGQKKAWSYLKGRAVAPEVVWTEDIHFFDVECADSDTEQVFLTNILTSNETLQDVMVYGPDADEFKVLNLEHGWTLPLDPSRPISPEEKLYVNVIFKADLSKGYRNRLAYLRAVTQVGIDDTMVISGSIVYADLKVSNTDIDFGTEVGGNTLKQTVRFTNPGTADLIVKSVSVTNPAFRVLSGIAPGDVIVKEGGYTDVQLEGTAPADGEELGELIVNGQTVCAPEQRAKLKIAGFHPTAQALGYPAPMTFVCRQNQGDAQFINGPVPVKLEKVEIVDGSSGNYAQHFQFADGSQTLILNKDIAGNATEKIPVIFKPTSVIPMNSSAVIRFTWSHTFQSKTTTSVIEQPISGGSQVLDNVLSVAKDDNSNYTADPMDRFSIDVKMLKDIIPAGDIKHVRFGIAFQQDLFRFESFDAGVTLSATHSDPDQTSTQLDTVWVDVTGDLTGQDILGTLQFTLLVSRDVESPFTIINPIMYSSDGSEACYMTLDEIPATFIPREWCGTGVIRNYLNGQLPTSVIKMTPNPAKDVINLTYDVNLKNVPVTIEVFDMLGNKVASVMQSKSHNAGRYTETINATKFATGNYTVRIQGGDHVSTRQVLIKH